MSQNGAVTESSESTNWSLSFNVIDCFNSRMVAATLASIDTVERGKLGSTGLVSVRKLIERAGQNEDLPRCVVCQ